MGTNEHMLLINNDLEHMSGKRLRLPNRAQWIESLAEPGEELRAFEERRLRRYSGSLV